MAPRPARKPGRAAPRVEIGIENFNTPAVLTSPVTGVLSNTACSVNVKQLAEITAGLWYNLYKGPYGRLTGGLQDEFIHRDRFPGLAGATPAAGFVSPSTDESIFTTSPRYYWMMQEYERYRGPEGQTRRRQA
jgi:hypothetical protein